MADQRLLQVENLSLHFRTSKGTVRAVDQVSFELRRNDALVILGESGSGKTSLTRALLRLLSRNVEHFSGRIVLDGVDVMSLKEEDFRQRVRWVKMSLVPQAAMNALNPVLKVGDQVAEPLLSHLGLTKTDAQARVRQAFQHVGIPVDFSNRYAFELSGGMRQRVAIAMALVTEPALIILDEPTSALDMLTQANILNVLKRIKHETETSFILITHDIATSSELANRVAVMYAGQIIEMNDAAHFFRHPLHPYAQQLMASVPKLRQGQEPEFISGAPPSLLDLPVGCRFSPRCAHRFAQCDVDPPLVMAGTEQQVKCWLYPPQGDRVTR